MQRVRVWLALSALVAVGCSTAEPAPSTSSSLGPASLNTSAAPAPTSAWPASTTAPAGSGSLAPPASEGGEGRCPADVAMAPAIVEAYESPFEPVDTLGAPTVYWIMEEPAQLRAALSGTVVAVKPSGPYDDDRLVTIESPQAELTYELNSLQRPFPRVGDEVAAGDSFGGAALVDTIVVFARSILGEALDVEELFAEFGCDVQLPTIDSVEITLMDGSQWLVTLPEPLQAAVSVQSDARLELDGNYVADAAVWPRRPNLDQVWDIGVGLPQLEMTHDRADGLTAESWWLTPGGCCAYLTWIALPDGRAFVISSSAPLADRESFVQSVEIDAAGGLSFGSDRYGLALIETAIYVRAPSLILQSGYLITLESIGCLLRGPVFAECDEPSVTLHDSVGEHREVDYSRIG